MKKFKIGIDNYGLYPLRLNPLETLQWARDHGAEGVAFSGLEPEEQKLINPAYLKDLRQYAETHNLYLEWGGAQHIPRDMSSWEKRNLFAISEKAAHEAEALGTRIVRSCSGGLMRWNPENPTTETLLLETAEALKSQRQMLKDHNVILAIETHFEFTTFELRKLFELCEAEPGDYLGVCLDTMNLLTMLEDPVSAIERILPWVVSTHIKDGALLLTSEGLTTFPVEVGTGVVDLKRIIHLLSTLSWDVNLSVEDHGGDFQLPIYDQRFLSEFPDLTEEEFAKLKILAQKTQAKLDDTECRIVEREKWGEVSEDRMKQNLLTLQKLLSDY
ncbi:MAG: TIM barrel protein [Candidatus Hatepunaea meridiana]|nr:TIM barrel protein [Candidatus Hatepunaea meridiana]